MKITFLSLCLLILSLVSVFAAHKQYYDLLGVEPSASQNDIKKAYRKLSMQYHPDVNPSQEAHDKFTNINNAYEVLSDPEKRRKYDQFGPDFEKQQQQQGGHPFGDFFGDFFEGGGHQRERKGPELVIKIPATLEHIYVGKEIGVYHTKQIICPHCRGSGADDPDHVKNCNVCGGSGFVIRRHQIGPGFFQQVQTQCDKCQGKGKIFTSTCHVCKSAKVMPGSDKFTLYIEKGVKHGHKLTFPDQGNEFVDMRASDISFVVIEIPHPRFKREGDNLRAVVEITLQEALLGFEKTLEHLDGHKVTLKRDFITQPGDVEKIKGEGMPQHTYSSYHGDLFVEYKVKLPTKLSAEQIKLWEEFFRNK